MKIAAALAGLANVLLLAYIAYTLLLAPSDRAAPRAELEPEKVKLLSGRDAAAITARTRPRACVDWGPLTTTELGRAQRVIEAEGLQYTERWIEGGTRWWVHVPPLANRRLAELRAQEVRRTGASEDPVVQEDPRGGFSISIGLFSSEGAAASLRDGLAKQGIRDVTVAARDNTNTRMALRIRDVPPAVVTRLTNLKAEFGGAEPRDCPPS